MAKIPFQISAKKKGKVAKVAIVGEIGWQVDSASFRTEVEALVKEGCTEANVYINSIGGSCFDASEIANILEENFTKITGDGGAIVASAAAYIAAKCETFTMPTNGQFMTHRPSGGAYGTIKDIEAYLKMVKETDADYLDTFLKKATNPEDFKKKWETGSDYWMNAEEAKAEGFITTIRKKVKSDKETTAMLRACANVEAKEKLSEFLNNNDTEMEGLAKVFELKDNASEQEIVAAAQKVVGQVVTLKADLKKEQDANKELQDKVDGYEAAEKAAKKEKADKEKAEAVTLVDAAIADGRIDDDEEHSTKNFWLGNFERDFEGSKAQLEKLPKKTDLKDRFGGGGGEGESAWDKRQQEIKDKNQ